MRKFLSIIFISFLCIFLLPSFFSTQLGKSLFLFVSNRFYPGTVQIETLNLSWFSPQKAKNIAYYDERGNLILEAEEITTTEGLYTLFLSSFRLNDLSVSKMHATLYQSILLKDFNITSVNGSLTLEGKTLSDGSLGTISANIEKIDPSLKSFLGRVQAENFPTKIIEIIASKFNPNLKQVILPSIGKTITVDIKSNFEGVFLYVNSPQIKGRFHFAFVDRKLILKEPGTLNFKLTPKLFSYFFKENISLKKEVKAKLLLEKGNLDVLSNSLKGSIFFDSMVIQLNSDPIAFERISLFFDKKDKLKIKLDSSFTLHQKQYQTVFNGYYTTNIYGNLKINTSDYKIIADDLEVKRDRFLAKSISIFDQSNTRLAGIENLLLSYQQTTKGYLLTFLGDTISSSSEKGKLNIKGYFNSYHDFLINGTLDKFPLIFFDLFSKNDVYRTLLGDTASIKIETNKNQLNLDISGESFSLNIPLIIKNNFVKTLDKNPIEFSFKMTPQKFLVFQGLFKNHKNHFQLKDTPLVKGRIDLLKAPLKDIKNVHVKASFHVDGFTLKDTYRDSLLVFTGVDLNGKVNRENFDFSLKTDQHQVTKKSRSHSVFYLKGSLKQILSSTPSIFIQAKGEKLPFVQLAELIHLPENLKTPLIAWFGDLCDIDMNINIQNNKGTIQSIIQGNQGFLHLNSFIQNNNLYLRDPLIAETTLTPFLAKNFLKDFVPFFDSAVEAQKPLHLKINPKGFVFSYKSKGIHSLVIKNGVLDLGKITFKESGSFSEILNLIRSNTGTGYTNVWFTPLHFSLSQGKLSIFRMDFLVSSKNHLATWGNIDLLNDKVDMNIGISGSAIKNIFNIKNVSNSFMLAIPFKGSTSNARIDKSKATPQFVQMIAEAQPGPQGKILGKVINILGKTIGAPSVPKPTTYPFPWVVEEKKTAPRKEKSSGKAFKLLKIVKTQRFPRN